MSHEWNCVCVRCERERDWLDAVDDEPKEQDAAEKMERLEGFLTVWGVRVSD
jgi:hypothetical protein